MFCFFFVFFVISSIFFFFFFQAEDGIRDRSPSRGLGDVYKRQSKRNHLHRHSRYFCCPRQLRQRIFPWLAAIGMSRAGRLLVAWLRPPRLEGAEFAAAWSITILIDISTDKQ